MFLDLEFFHHELPCVVYFESLGIDQNNFLQTSFEPERKIGFKPHCNSDKKTHIGFWTPGVKVVEVRLEYQDS